MKFAIILQVWIERCQTHKHRKIESPSFAICGGSGKMRNIYIYIYIYMYKHIRIYIYMCVCVDHLHRCKTSFGCSGFSTLSLQGVAADHLGPLPTKTPIWSGDTDWDANLRTCTNFHFRQWRPAKPSTGMSFGFFHFPLWIMLHLNLLQNFGVNRFHPLYGFRNLNYCWLR